MIFTIFSLDGVNDVRNFKYVCPEFLCYVCGLISLSAWLFLWFLIYGLVQVLFFSIIF
jgi:hypothetical protein